MLAGLFERVLPSVLFPPVVDHPISTMPSAGGVELSRLRLLPEMQDPRELPKSAELFDLIGAPWDRGVQHVQS